MWRDDAKEITYVFGSSTFNMAASWGGRCMLLTSSFLARLMCCFSVLLVYPMEISEVFKKRKEQCLSRADLSRKGNVDADIVSLVRFINERDPFFTTSSCSGRVTLIDGCSHDFEVKKKNCSWLLVTHQKCQKDDVIAALQRASGDAVLKFEPFVLHVQCRQLEDAQLLHSVALNAGFRNSGITVGKKGKTVMVLQLLAVCFEKRRHSWEIGAGSPGLEIRVYPQEEKASKEKRWRTRFPGGRGACWRRGTGI
ncbi:tRNA wybutosine-synthesizing protein 3 homolog isoform X3 [Rhinatrema bivittatum]|uniref:tRNA wybutosine-synthesizing protein 3 homolog isoform X3 n=1 Tax=Rhinatrema bivittatum TaxID=194408 RepID=UPI00112E94F8|nr:tRNA wybutosine-synthesizing protein 3 homolog isoform X3 [Rhinatrema bivittatum]